MKVLRYAGVVVGLTGAQLFIASSGYIVAEGPPPMINEVMVVAPSPRHAWMPGYYSYQRGYYVY